MTKLGREHCAKADAIAVPSADSVLQSIPHRPPFLFIDDVIEIDDRRIVARKYVDPGADFFRGHYPGNPIMPGVLICECCFQAGALLIAHRYSLRTDDAHVPVLTRITDARFKHLVRPGDMLQLEVQLDDELEGAYFLTGRATVNEKQAVRVTFACMLATTNGETT